MKKQMPACQRGSFVRLIIFLILVGVLLSYIGSQSPGKDGEPSPMHSTLALSIEPAGMAMLAPSSQPEIDYFIDYRLERDSARQQQLDLLREMINNPNSGEQARQEADRRFLYIADILGKEMEIEGLIRAKGFPDALVLINETTATAIVNAATLDQREVAQVCDIIVRTTGLSPTAISVIAYAQ